MLAAHPVVSRSHLAFLEYRCDTLSRKLASALGRIFRAQVAAAPQRVTPTFEIVPAPSVKCKHGLREAWCAACKELGNQDHLAPRKESRGCVAGPWMTFMYPPACPPREEHRFSTMVIDQRGTKSSAGCGHNDGFKKKSVIRVVAADVDHSGYVWQNRVKALVLTPIEPGWGWTEPKFGDALSLEEYADVPRHRNNEAATLPHLPNYCDGCLRHVTVLHDRTDCAAKKQTANQEGTERPICKPDGDCPKAKSVSALARVLKNDDLAASLVEKVDTRFYKAPFQIVQGYRRWLKEREMIAKKHDHAPHEMRSVNDILLGSV